MLNSPDIFLIRGKIVSGSDNQAYVTRMVTENKYDHITKLYFHIVWNSHNNKLGQNSLPIKRSPNIKSNELNVN